MVSKLRNETDILLFHTVLFTFSFLGGNGIHSREDEGTCGTGGRGCSAALGQCLSRHCASTRANGVLVAHPDHVCVRNKNASLAHARRERPREAQDHDDECRDSG